MKKLTAVLLFVCMLFCVSTISFAEEINISEMTYEELEVLRNRIDAAMEELRRRYAIENGNRVIALDCDKLILFEKQKQEIVPNVTRVVEDAPEKTEYVWTTSDEAVATVSSQGTVTAVSAGEAVITCTASDDEYIFASVPVEVVLRVTDVSIAEEIDSLRISEKNPELRTAQLNAIIQPENAFCQTVTWVSSDESVIEVDQAGHIVAVGAGTATISATSDEEVARNSEPKKSSRKITVVQDVEQIELDQVQIKVKKGNTAKLNVTVSPENATNDKVKWESSDETVATVAAGGNITAKGCGVCQITCSATDESGESDSCYVIVYQPVTSIKFEQTSINAYIGTTPVQLQVTISPDDATDKRVVWTSSDPSVASVDSDGMITAVGGGSCEITCAATDGSEKSASMTVHVPSISVEKESYAVTEKKGLEIPIHFFGKSIDDLNITVGDKRYITAELIERDTVVESQTGNTGSQMVDGKAYSIKVMPERAGTTTITLKDGDNKNAVKLNITVENSAVYNSKSYPKADYEEILRYPDDHYGKNYQIYGKVLQKMQSGSTVVLRVGTTNRYYDSVFYVQYSTDDVSASVIEDDFVTIYGNCRGAKTYETVRGDEVTIPYLRAEKIEIGRKSN